MVAVEAVRSPADFVALRKALADGVAPEPDAVADPAVNLRALLKAPATVS
jgi:hypothetical protein